PPNHQLRNLSLTGVVDPDDDPVTLTITGIDQDEPLTGPGSKDSCPDATVVGGSTAVIRVERAASGQAHGDGRVYHITFSADDHKGGKCTATVTSCVPIKPGLPCIDQGPLFDST